MRAAAPASSPKTPLARRSAKGAPADPTPPAPARPASKPKADAARPAAKAAAGKPVRPASPRRTSRRPPIERRPSRARRWLAAARRALAPLGRRAFWQGLRAKLPPWTDEVGALLLLVLGVVLLTALLTPDPQARLSVWLSRGLRQLFGGGAYVAALMVSAAGVLLLLPKFGVTPRLTAGRALAVELAFAALLALLHLAADDPEPRLLARDGGGGGYIGWALTQLPLGAAGLALLYGALLAVALALAADLRVQHFRRGIGWLRGRLAGEITRLGGEPSAAAPAQTPAAAPRPTITLPGRRPSLVPRPDAPAPGANADFAAPADPAAPSAPRPPRPKRRPIPKAQQRELALRIRRQHGAENGRSLIAPGAPGARDSIVPRELAANGSAAPAARPRPAGDDGADRYFTVADFQTARKIGKRDTVLPPLDLLSDVELNKPTEEEINTNARIIRNTLLEFDVETEVVDVHVGPTVTQYAVSPYTETLDDNGEWVLNRVRVSEITQLNGDLALALSAKRLRIQAPVPGTSYVGIEVPNRQPSTVALRPVLESEVFYRSRQRPLALPLGRDVSGEAFVADLAGMPHLLIAGTTGSGKSIMLAAMTASFVMNNPPDRVKLILLDPKMVELSRFNGLPHLLGPVETELDRIIGVLRWATREMDHRYKLLEKEAARNLDTYNRALGRRRKDEQLPYIVIIIDEIGDLMMQRPDETERTLTRLAQMARAVGMHLMVATQRPSVDVITGLIKANFPARISFAVASGVDSRVILDASGAETLMGRGDMLFLAPDAAGPQRLQGCYISDEEVAAVVDYWRTRRADEIEAGHAELPPIPPWERGMTRREVLSETDPMLEEAITVVVEEQEASASLLQRRLGLGYPRAARIIDMMHELGIVGPAQPGGRTRDVLVKPGEDPFKRIVDGRLRRKTEGDGE